MIPKIVSVFCFSNNLLSIDFSIHWWSLAESIFYWLEVSFLKNHSKLAHPFGCLNWPYYRMISFFCPPYQTGEYLSWTSDGHVPARQHPDSVYYHLWEYFQWNFFIYQPSCRILTLHNLNLKRNVAGVLLKLVPTSCWFIDCIFAYFIHLALVVYIVFKKKT